MEDHNERDSEIDSEMGSVIDSEEEDGMTKSPALKVEVPKNKNKKKRPSLLKRNTLTKLFGKDGQEKKGDHSDTESTKSETSSTTTTATTIEDIDSEQQRLENMSHWEKTLYYKYNNRVAFCIPNTFLPRRLLIRLVELPLFDAFILLIILFNCIVLMVYDPRVSEQHIKNQIVRICGYVFQAIFMVEAIIKIAAKGFIGHSHAYLFHEIPKKNYIWDVPPEISVKRKSKKKNPKWEKVRHTVRKLKIAIGNIIDVILSYIAAINGWNLLDFFIVVVGVTSFFETGQNASISILRAIRILRPLKALSTFPRVRLFFTAFVSSLPLLVNVIFLFGFLVWIFGIISLQFFKNIPHQVCASVTDGTLALYDEAYHTHTIVKPYIHCNTDISCPIGYTCQTITDTSYNYLSFDNIFTSMFVIYQVAMKETWYHWVYILFTEGGWYQGLFIIFTWFIFTSFIGSLFIGIIKNTFEQQLIHMEDLKTKGKTKNQLFRKTQSTLSLTKSQKRDSTISLRNDSEDSTEPSTFFPDKKPFVIIRVARWLKLILRKQYDTLFPGYLTINKWLANDKSRREAKVENVRRVEEGIDDSISQSTTQTRVTSPTHSGQQKSSEFNAIKRLYFHFLNIYYTIQRKLRPIVFSTFVTVLITLVILVNTIALAVEHHGQPAWLTLTVQIINVVCVAFYIVELLIKFFVLGLAEFISDFFNLFDTVIVVVSIIEIPLSFMGTINGSFFSIFRILRIFRVIKIASTVPALRKLLDGIAKSFFTTLVVFFLLGFYILIFSLLGMQLFGKEQGTLVDVGTSAYRDTSPRLNFYDFISSIRSVLLIITSERYYPMMINSINQVSGYYTIPYYILCALGGRYLMVSIFIAILLEKTESVREESTRRKSSLLMDKMKSTYTSIANTFTKKKKKENSLDNGPYKTPVHIIQEEIGQQPMDIDSLKDQPIPRDDTINSKAEDLSAKPSLLTQNSIQSIDIYSISSMRQENENTSQLQAPTETLPTNPSVFSAVTAKTIEDEEEKSTAVPITVRMKSTLLRNPFTSECGLFFIPKNFLLRAFIRYICETKIFAVVITLAVLVSCVELCLFDPFRPPDDIMNIVLDIIQIVISIIFIIEAIAKILAYGFILHKTSYLRRSWFNVLDFFLVIISVSSFLLVNENIGSLNILRSVRSLRALRSLRSLRSLRALRALRPLRVLGKFEGLKLIVDGLLRSIIPLTSVLVIGLLVFIVFGIMGVQLFAGTFRYCEGDSSILSATTCTNAGHNVVTLPANFDNIGNAMVTLLHCSTLEGWTDVLFAARDVQFRTQTNDNLLNPDLNAWWYDFYMYSFILVGSIYMSNLFVTALLTTFQEMRSDKMLNELTPPQRDWFEIQRKMLNTTLEYKAPKPAKFFWWEKYFPIYKLRLFVYHIVVHWSFEFFIIFLVLLNAIQLSLDYFNSSSIYRLVLDIVSYCFTTIFGIEILLKLFGFGFTGFFSDFWNIFDFIIQVVTLIGLFISINTTSTVATSIAAIFRVFRVTRLFKILRRATGMRSLLQTLITSVPNIINVLLLLILLLMVYAVLGMQLFARVNHTGIISTYNNFDNLGAALLSLIRILSGEDWYALMYQLLIPSNCSKKFGNCPETESYITVIYFSTFIILSQFILLNLFTHVILENFTDIRKDYLSSVSKDALDLFTDKWGDKNNNSFKIRQEDFPILLRQVGEPLGVHALADQDEIVDILRNIDLYVDGGYIHFYETLYALTALRFEVPLPDKIQTALDKRWAKLYSKSRSGSVLIQLGLGSVTKEVTIVLVQVDRVVESIEDDDSSDESVMSEFQSDVVKNFANRFNGEYIPQRTSNKDRIRKYLIAFNTTTLQKHHIMQASKLALNIWKKKESRGFKDRIRVHCSIVTGTHYVGPIGTVLSGGSASRGRARRRRRRAFGRIEKIASGLLLLGKYHHIGIITDEQVFVTMREHFHIRPVDIFPGNVGGTSHFWASELIDKIEFKADEWLYELKQLNHNKRFENFVMGFNEMMNDHLDDAIALFSDYKSAQIANASGTPMTPVPEANSGILLTPTSSRDPKSPYAPTPTSKEPKSAISSWKENTSPTHSHNASLNDVRKIETDSEDGSSIQPSSATASIAPIESSDSEDPHVNRLLDFCYRLRDVRNKTVRDVINLNSRRIISSQLPTEGNKYSMLKM